VFKKLRTIPVEYRAYAYRVLTALSLAATAGGVLTDDQASAWLLVAAAVLGIGSGTLAAANTPKPGQP